MLDFTADEMHELAKDALQLGKDTAFSAQEAARGIAELREAGVEMADALDTAARAVVDMIEGAQDASPISLEDFRDSEGI